MEIITHDDTESIKFIHGPRFRFCNNKPARILICNPLKYLIVEKNSQITIFDLNVILSNSDGLTYFESKLDEIKHAQLGNYDFGHESAITHIVLDFSSTILTVVIDTKILLFNLLDLDQKSEWISINHDGIQSITWTQNHDLITIESDGSCSFYYFIPSEKDFYRTKLILDGSSDNFTLVEACKSNFCGIQFILISESEKNIILITNELYNMIISSQSKFFNIPKSFIRPFSTLIGPITDVFQGGNSKMNLINQLHITSAKFIDGEDLYLSISLIGGLEYMDGYVLFFKIDSDLKVELSSYSINDLCFDNVDSNDMDQIKKIRCVSFWVKEWGILFIGSAVFSQMIVFTPNHSYINKENLNDYKSHNWVRLAMCEGYDINCTDFDIGIFDSCLCTCNKRSIRDPKLTIDAPQISQPPIIFIAETNGDIITHYIGGDPKLIKPIKSEELDSLITNYTSCNSLSRQDLESKNQVPTNNYMFHLVESPLTKFSISSKKDNSNSSLKAIEQILRIQKYKPINQGISMINKSEEKLFDSIMKIESQVLQLEKKFININEKVLNVLNSPLIAKRLINFCEFVDKIKIIANENSNFYKLISKFNEISNIEIQLRRLHLYLMKKISEDVYKNTKIEILKEKLRKNELTSSQISILFQYNIELFGLLIDNGVDKNQVIMNSLISIETLSLKLASRISQVSIFCERLNYRKSMEFEFTSLPPPEYNYNTLHSNEQSYATPNKIPFDSHRNSNSQKIPSSSVRISKKNNFDSQPDSKGKHRIYSSKKNINLSDIINNISNSVIKDDLYKPSFSSENESNILKVQRLKINNYVSQNNTPGRYIQIRSKYLGYSCDEVLSDKLGVNNRPKLQNNTFFELSWIPGLIEEKNASLKLMEHSSHSFETKNKYYVKQGMPNLILTNCIERLERIVDHCEIANGSISFIEREELLPKFIKKIGKDSVKTTEISSKSLLTGNRIITSQLLLSRNSSLQKNMIYRQKLLLILSGFVGKLSNSKSTAFPQNTNCSFNDLKSRVYNKFDQKDLNFENSQQECISAISFAFPLEKNQNPVTLDYKTVLLEQQGCIDTNDLLSGSPNIPGKTNLKNSNIGFVTELGDKTVLKHPNYMSEATPSDKIDFCNYIETKFDKDSAKTNSNMAYKKITQDDESFEPDLNNTSFCTNNPNLLNNSLNKTTCELVSNNGNSINLEFNKQKNEILQKDIKSSFFSLSLINNETPNSKRASEGIFAFSTEMNISLNLNSPDSKRDHVKNQISDELNIFSFSSDSNPLKPINICSPPKQSSDANHLSSAIVKNGLHELDELDVSKVNASTISTNIGSTIENGNSTLKFQGNNDLEQKDEESSKPSINLGGVFGFPNSLSNMNNAPKVSGFGSSQFLINGPFSSNNGGNSLCGNPKNDSTIEEAQSFEFSAKNLNNSIPFKAYPSSDNSTGGFVAFSSEFHGFSPINAQNSTINSFPNNLNNNIFNFAPPQKPRQVNKLD
ncbi:uncharacterized protein cubi_02934 [Cryptosporidium ubiquitum]|uniref:Uncharacterized protein n=1 Tax=Cryptosporidium ubiquitum TaxID=857276 RepID=A0A1J4MMA2_9CRYT|nr:uncharacterized protein cubi_02934 [Cryptosporidium ubiquitum]OII74132.1 hypothetical protein cubi_02934 [Cryptosporidium ubiquitum]